MSMIFPFCWLLMPPFFFGNAGGKSGEQNKLEVLLEKLCCLCCTFVTWAILFLLLLSESRSRDDKDLQLSDLDDFDAIESESSECDLKHQFHINAHMNTLPEHLKETSLKLPSLNGDTLKLPSIRTTLERDTDLPKSCLKTSSRDCEHNPNGNTKLCFQQDHQTLDSKPRIWSLAQTATSLNPNEYSSCMLRCPLAIPGSSSPPVKVAEKQQDSPVTTLRHWMDGVFHDPLFKHSTLDQAHNSNTTISWSTTKGSVLDSGTQRDWSAHVRIKRREPKKKKSFV